MLYNSGTNESAGAGVQTPPAWQLVLGTPVQAKSIPTLTTEQEERFWNYVEVHQPAGCWEWTVCKNDKGYGMFSVSGNLMAHRISYTLLIGAIPADMQLDHLCRNKSCVNPDHLQVVTGRENILRSYSSSAMRARQTHCKRGHEFTPANTYYPPHRPSNRECLTCKTLLRRRWRAHRSSLAVPPITTSAGSDEPQ